MVKATKQITLTDLQAYITGAIELNHKGWHPDAKQWNKIVKMIMSIEPLEQVVAQERQNIREVNQTNGTPHGGSAMDFGNDAVPVPSGASQDDRRINPAEDLHTMGGKDQNGVVSSGKHHKTPNKDVSNGDKSQFDSDFA